MVSRTPASDVGEHFYQLLNTERYCRDLLVVIVQDLLLLAKKSESLARLRYSVGQCLRSELEQKTDSVPSIYRWGPWAPHRTKVQLNMNKSKAKRVRNHDINRVE